MISFSLSDYNFFSEGDIYANSNFTLEEDFITYSQLANYLVVKDERNSVRQEEIQSVLDGFKRDFIHGDSCCVDIALKEINPVYTRVLFDVFRFLRDKKRSGTSVSVMWRYDPVNIEILETGIDFSEIFELDFSLVLSE